MNLLAAVKGIAPAGGIRPASHITASFVSATKAKPAAHYLVPAILSIALGRPTGAIAAVIEGRLEISGRSDLSRSSTLSGQRSKTDERHIGRQRFGLSPRTVGATSRSGGHRMVSRDLGNPCAEKVSAHRSRQNKGAASLTKAHGAFRKIGEAVMASEPDACAGVGSPRQGTLTITGSNVRLGTEMPVALSLF